MVKDRVTLATLVVFPLIFSILLPLVFIIVATTPEVTQTIDGIDAFLAVLPSSLIPDYLPASNYAMYAIANFVPLPLFVTVPVMISNVIASTAFIGEKRTAHIGRLDLHADYLQGTHSRQRSRCLHSGDDHRVDRDFDLPDRFHRDGVVAPPTICPAFVALALVSVRNLPAHYVFVHSLGIYDVADTQNRQSSTVDGCDHYFSSDCAAYFSSERITDFQHASSDGGELAFIIDRYCVVFSGCKAS